MASDLFLENKEMLGEEWIKGNTHREAYFLSINKIKKNTTIYTNSHHYTSHFLLGRVLPGVGYTQQTPSIVKVNGARCLCLK